MNKKNLQIVILVILIVMMAACLPGCIPATESRTPTPVTAPPSRLPSITPSPENTIIVTVSPTRKPTATRPPTRTPLPIQTDLPTIPSGDINAILDALHNRCQLPCLGGIIPGKTSQYAAERLLSPLIEYESSGEILVGLGFEHGLVSFIHLFAPPLIKKPYLTKPYRIYRLLTEFGVPEDIQLEVLPETADLTTYYNLVLLYPSQGILAKYSARGTVLNSIISVCPRNVSPELLLFPSAAYTVEEMNKEFVFHRHAYYRPINELTGVDIKQFYEIFRNPDSTCIPTNMKPIHP